MTKGLLSVSYSGLIAWLDMLFLLFMAYQTCLELYLHHFSSAAITAPICAALAFCSITAFSAAGQTRRFRWLFPMLITAGLLNLSFGLMADNQTLFYLFTLMCIGNLVSARSAQMPSPTA